MLRIQVVPRGNENIYQLLCEKINNDAKTFAWKDKKTKPLSIVNIGRSNTGQIRMRDADGVLVADTHEGDQIVGAFIARLADWFPAEIAAINIQVLVDDTTKKKAKKK